MIRKRFSAGKAAGKDEGKKPTDSVTEVGEGGSNPLYYMLP